MKQQLELYLDIVEIVMISKVMLELYIKLPVRLGVSSSFHRISLGKVFELSVSGLYL